MARESFSARAIRQRAAQQGRPLTILEYSLARGGMRKGPRAVAYLALWTVARRRAGEEPHWTLYADLAAVSKQNAYKHLRVLQEVYGDALAAFADEVEAEAGDELDAAMAKVQGMGDDETAAASVWIGSLRAPPAVAL